VRKCMVPFVALWTAAAIGQDIQDKAPSAEATERILEELRLLRAEVAELTKRVRALEGHIGEALETAFGLIGGDKRWLAESARDAILRHTEAAGSDEELKAFSEKNKGRFRWDKDRRKFVVEKP